jgi:phage tail sheath protein FI
MPDYRAPGIYVEEVPSAIRPIAGVSTSTAGFIGVVPGKLPQITKDPKGTAEAPTKWVELTVPTPANTARLITNWTQFTAAFGDLVGDPEGAAANGSAGKAVAAGHRNLAHAVYGFFNNGGSRCFVVRIADEDSLDAGLKALAAIDEIAVVAAPGLTSPTARDKIVTACKAAERFAILDGPQQAADLTSLTTPSAADAGPAAEAPADQTPKVEVAVATTAPLELAPAYDNKKAGAGATLTAGSPGALTVDGVAVGKDDRVLVKDQAEAAENGIYTLTTPGTDAAKYVLTRSSDFEKSADIAAGAIVSVAKGGTNGGKMLKADPKKAPKVGTDAITFVTYEPAAAPPAKAAASMPAPTDGAAWYFPWIEVFDPATKLLSPAGDGSLGVPPSGHLAGIYARVDAGRGVHKAPANEAMLGALGVTQAISRPEQMGLNPKGVNCIRVLNGSVVVWGARTVGGDANADLKYINVRRTLLFLRKSLEQGTQWVVFEPNSPALWQQITRNVTAFLTTVWRSGALFGTTAAEAFYVKCDAENNPPGLRDLGQVVIEVGVAIVRPAEFVIFRISQLGAAGQ